jgi:hypothetical protein
VIKDIKKAKGKPSGLKENNNIQKPILINFEDEVNQELYDKFSSLKSNLNKIKNNMDEGKFEIIV